MFLTQDEINMNLSTSLQSAIDSLVAGKDSKKIRENVSNICNRYINELGKGKELVQTPEEVIAYAVSRMPATYCAVTSVLSQLSENYQGKIKSLLDFGSGTGAVYWAASELFELDKVLCVERERYMIKLARDLVLASEEKVESVSWLQSSVSTKLDLETYDLVTASYMMNELSSQEKQIFLENVWNHSKDIILILEPGTMVGYQDIMMARSYMISKGGNILAPCTHIAPCCLGKEDWCHFSCRVQRNRLQKYVKGGEAPYEDEKYSYLIVSKKELIHPEEKRILRHPKIHKGLVEVEVCTESGPEEIKISSHNKELYKSARKAEWGALIKI